MARTETKETIKLRLASEAIGSEVSEIEDDEESDAKVEKILSLYKSNRELLDFLPPTPVPRPASRSSTLTPSPRKGTPKSGLVSVLSETDTEDDTDSKILRDEDTSPTKKVLPSTSSQSRRQSLPATFSDMDACDEGSEIDSEENKRLQNVLSRLKIDETSSTSQGCRTRLSSLSSSSASPEKSRRPTLVAVSDLDTALKSSDPVTKMPLSKIKYNPVFDSLEFIGQKAPNDKPPSPLPSTSAAGSKSKTTKQGSSPPKKNKPGVTFATFSKKKKLVKAKKKMADIDTVCENLGFKLDDDDLQELNGADEPDVFQPRVDNIIEDILEKGKGIKRHPVTRKVITREEEKFQEQNTKAMRKVPLEFSEDGRVFELKGDVVTVKDTLEKVNALISVLEKAREKLVNNDKNLVYTAPPMKIKKPSKFKLHQDT